MRDVGFVRVPVILAALLAAILLLSCAVSAEAEELPEGGCENLLVQVDKEYSLSPLYAPPDMVYISDYGVPSLNWGAMLRAEPADHLAELVATAGHEGNELIVASSYRSFYDQSLTHGFYTNLYGAEADRVSALPGHSEHQLGTTVDFTNAEAGYQIKPGLRRHQGRPVAPGECFRVRLRLVVSGGRGREDRLPLGALALSLRRCRERPQSKRIWDRSPGFVARGRREAGL